MSGHCPNINGQKPNEEFNLDDKSHLVTLGFGSNYNDEIADSYVHYPHCDWAVIEWEGSTVHKAIRQIERTIEHLVRNGRKVDLAIVVKKG